jgi:hypothetical protein
MVSISLLAGRSFEGSLPYSARSLEALESRLSLLLVVVLDVVGLLVGLFVGLLVGLLVTPPVVLAAPAGVSAEVELSSSESSESSLVISLKSTATTFPCNFGT